MITGGGGGVGQNNKNIVVLSQFISSAIFPFSGQEPIYFIENKKRHYEHEHHMIEAHKYLITWFSDDIFENSG
jgi:hypothetical protein